MFQITIKTGIMKRLILSLFVVLLGATSAMGQGYTADWVVESSNELLYKVSERGNVIRMELYKKEGGVLPMLMFGKDSLCLLMPETNSYAVFTGEEMRGKTKELLGFELESISNTTTKEYIDEEVVSGVSCIHYFVIKEDAAKVTAAGTSTIREGGYSYDVWESAQMRHPVKKYNHVDARMEVMTGVRFTPMSADKFIVPKGWTRTSMDAMMDVVNMFMKGAMEGDADALNKLGDFMKEARSARDGKGNTGNQAKDLNSLLDMFGGGKK